MNREQYLRQLRQAIAEHFDMEELQALAYDLSVDWDELAGDVKSRKILSLLIHLAQTNRLVPLLALLRQERPHYGWPDLPLNLPIFVPQPLTQAGRVRQALLQKVRTFWIDGLLYQSLYRVARLDLGLAYDPEAVDRPWMMQLERPSTPTTAIPPHTALIDIFQQLNDSLLILGEPGAGKTTLLLELARDLLDIAELDDSQPIPVIANLSSWATEQRPLADWLVAELNLIYQVNKKYGRQWLADEPFHLLLDGLDEVKAEQRLACVAAINQFRQEYGLTKIVVCSRTADYQSLTTQLQLLNAVIIHPLTPDQVDDYLDSVGELTAVKQALHYNPALQELALTPLILSILSLAYQGATDIHSPQQLFATYIQRMFARRRTSAAYQQQALDWLNWLAQHLKNHSQTIFHLDNLQPTALTTPRQKREYQLLSRLLLGLIMALMLGLPLGLGGALIGRTAITIPLINWLLPHNSLAVGLGGALSFGFAAALFPGLMGINLGRVTYLEALSWSRPQKPHLLFALIATSTFGLILTLIIWSLSQSIPIALIIGGVAGLLSGLIVLLSGSLFNWDTSYGQKIGQLIAHHVYQTKGGFHNTPILHTTHPLQRVRSSSQNALYLGLAGGGLLLLAGLVIGLVIWLVDGVAFGISNVLYQYFVAELGNKLVAGLLYGLFIGLAFGWIVGWAMALRPLTAVCQHHILRTILTRAHHLPPQPIPFLDEMVEQLILRRVGGGYIFIHRLLQDHLAAGGAVNQ